MMNAYNIDFGYAESSSDVYSTTKGTKDTKRKSKLMCFPFVHPTPAIARRSGEAGRFVFFVVR
jgi:hypothetical protein